MTASATCLVRIDEIFLKGKNQRDFMNALRRNICRIVGIPASAIHGRRGRLLVDVPPGQDPALGRVFGVRSYSPARIIDNDPEAMAAACITIAEAAVADGDATFKIEVRRANKRFPYTSMELARDLGARVLDAVPALRVDVHRPDRPIGVEIRDRTYVYGRVEPGPGGMPVGVAGRGLLLISGGIDSPVAGWLAMKRGIAIDALYFHSAPYTGPRVLDKVRDLVTRLSGYTPQPIRLHVAHFTPVLEALREHVPEPLWTVALRRQMMRLADRLAERMGALALVTGDAVGQVASQTLENLARSSEVTERLVLRPLAGMDKHEIVALARRIGTFDVSTRPFEDCCSLFAPSAPRTRVSRKAMERAEARFDTDGLIADALASLAADPPPGPACPVPQA